MPYRVQRIEEIVNQLESGDLKLRVRVLEVFYYSYFNHCIDTFTMFSLGGPADPFVSTWCHSRILNPTVRENDWFFFSVSQSERAAQKATILQMATMYTVFGGTLLNLGVTLTNQGSQIFANGSFIGAGSSSFIHTLSYIEIRSSFRH